MDKWAKVEVDLSKLLGPINDVIALIDSVLAFVITILNIVSAILDVIKVFLLGLLDPIRAIVEAIIAEIRSIIEDLKQLGVYVCGDWELAQPNYADLLGGYQAYERRMLARLLDRADPNRPDFSSSSAALAAFFYFSSGDVADIIKGIRAILAFFGGGNLLGKASPYPAPTAPGFVYGTEGAGFGAFRGLAESLSDPDNALPDTVSVTWSMPSGLSGKTLFNSTPKGFLIHASTIPDGFQVLGLTPITQTSQEVEGLPRIKSVMVDPQTNGPLTLYGGVSDIGTASDPTQFTSVEADSAQANAMALKLDQVTPILRPSTLIKDGKPLVADTFFAKVNPLSPQSIGGGTKFTARFKKSELPREAKFERGSDGYGEVVSGSVKDASSYTFRIRAVSKEYADLFGESGGTLLAPKSVFGSSVRLFNIPNTVLTANSGAVLPYNTGKFEQITADDPNWNSFSKAGGPGVALLPSSAQKDFVNAVKTAFALALLCRADLTEWVPPTEGASYDPTLPSTSMFSKNSYPPGGSLQGLEEGGRALMNKYGANTLLYRKASPLAFRRAVRAFVNNLGSDLLSGTPPPDVVVEAILENENVKKLLEFRWSDEGWSFGDTILESLSSKDPDNGLSSNPLASGPGSSKKQLRLAYASAPATPGAEPHPARNPGFMLQPDTYNLLAAGASWNPGEGSADFSPVLIQSETGSVQFVRNAILGAEDGEAILAGAVLVLQIGAAVRPINDGDWLSIRLMPQGFPALEELLDKVERILLGILDGLQGIIDVIIAYIEAIQARIFQLQAFIEAIRALLKQLQLFTIGPLSGLVFVESGTDGIITSFLTAENKPSDSPTAYGGGLCVVAGGLPSILLEAMFLLLGGGGDE